ncbi:cupin domain-containing protein [Rhabdothermincola salaria]|uniref:cupin domain-containing protein n=1 Tax=Rhabdothermincola salaria TaxID=2903142 RepID=UPI001E3F1CBB|nr:cupin domain-containing protein [Rhabdothermincola salaria]MCD9624476.1 cupin domain-containing protein [Rhabdothermincola salaria]
MADVRRGRLEDGRQAPGVGETHHVLAHLGAVRVEHILSGHLERAERFVSDADEWVVVLTGSARLEIAGEVLDLAAGDWVTIPAATPHVLHETEPGTSWLAVHAPAAP